MAHTILVVDDDPVIRMLVSEYLGLYGHTVEVLDHGSECIQKLKASRPDILVLDMLMPDITGQEILATLRADPETAGIPVIMLSADMHMANHSGVSARADCYLQKPFNVKEVLAAISQVEKHC